MEVFVLIKFNLGDRVDDQVVPYYSYSYVEELICVYNTFEEAKIEVDKMLCDDEDIVEYKSFIRIIKMTVGDKKKEIVYQSIHDNELGWDIFNE